MSSDQYRLNDLEVKNHLLNEKVAALEARIDQLNLCVDIITRILEKITKGN